MNEISPDPDLDVRGFVLMPEFDSFIGHLGGVHWRIDERAVGTALRIVRRHCNPINLVHGGVLTTLLDVTLGATAQTALGGHDGPHPVTIQLSCSFVGGAKLGDLIEGAAQLDSATRTLSFTSGRLTANGKTIATAAAVFRNPPASA